MFIKEGMKMKPISVAVLSHWTVSYIGSQALYQESETQGLWSPIWDVPRDVFSRLAPAKVTFIHFCGKSLLPGSIFPRVGVRGREVRREMQSYVLSISWALEAPAVLGQQSPPGRCSPRNCGNVWEPSRPWALSGIHTAITSGKRFPTKA